MPLWSGCDSLCSLIDNHVLRARCINCRKFLRSKRVLLHSKKCFPVSLRGDADCVCYVVLVVCKVMLISVRSCEIQQYYWECVYQLQIKLLFKSCCIYIFCCRQKLGLLNREAVKSPRVYNSEDEFLQVFAKGLLLRLFNRGDRLTEEMSNWSWSRLWLEPERYFAPTNPDRWINLSYALPLYGSNQTLLIKQLKVLQWLDW